ncbi:MAG TPA: hypothetical protein VGQ87_00015 [Patescibacteria group bacterium]|jgi:hypothetical protein|nr:hypothetical protein [Patescibacteria group bacterium]
MDEQEAASLLKKSSTFAAVTAVVFVMSFGVAVGGFISYNRSVNQRAEGLVFGTATDLQPISSSEMTQQDSINSEDLIPYPKLVSVTDPPKLEPTPAPTPAPKLTGVVNVCQQALEELTAAKISAQQDEVKLEASIKATFDTEQKTLIAQLSDYSRQRVGAVNNYLGQIAIATSKYNQSTDPNAYNTYKKEQADAFKAYSDIITKIGDDEGKVLIQKKDSETKYNADVLAAQSQMTSVLGKAEVQYQSRISGIGCPGV